MKYLLDSNVLIYSARLEAHFAVARAWPKRTDAAVSALSQLEVLGYSAITAAEVRYFTATLLTLPALPISEQILVQATELRRNFRLKVPDAIIAATALVHSLKLVTADAGFTRVEGLTTVHPLAS